MREILFRGKSLYTDSPNTPGHWLEGNLFVRSCSEHIIRSGFTGLEVELDSPNAVWTQTIGQYTGLKDKNGKKIFEGDIVKMTWAGGGENKSYIVRFDEGRAGWFPFACGDGCGCCEDEVEPPNMCVVIGNIHDNPELLEVKEI